MKAVPGTKPGVTLAMLLFAAAAVWPAHAFRCGHDLIQEGDRPHEVRSHCGEPDYRDRHADAYLEGIGPLDVTETWYYNPGPSGLVRILTFRRGKLRSIETGGRGFNETRVGGRCDPYALDVGMSKFELLGRCGEPAARDQWLAHDPTRFTKRTGPIGVVLVEEWTYTFGPNRFRRFIRIVNGRITDIDRGDKGR